MGQAQGGSVVPTRLWGEAWKERPVGHCSSWGEDQHTLPVPSLWRHIERPHRSPPCHLPSPGLTRLFMVAAGGLVGRGDEGSGRGAAI